MQQFKKHQSFHARPEYGSRTPMRDTPVWATLEVLKGGFASGKLLAEEPPQPWELQLCTRYALDSSCARLALNEFFSQKQAGKSQLKELLYSRRYRVELPEHAALLAVACLRDQEDEGAARSVLKTLEPMFATVRFYPRPLESPVYEHPAQHVFLKSVRAVMEDVARVRDSLPYRQMVESITVWEPLYCQTAALWSSTVDVHSGWPCQHYPDTFAAEAEALLQQYASLRRVHQLVARVDTRRSHFWTLRSMLARWRSLTERDVGLIRQILRQFHERRTSPRYHSRQLQQVASATTAQHARRLLVSLGPWAQHCEALDGAECGSLVDSMPASLRRKVWRCVAATPRELLEKDVIRCGDHLAAVAPLLVAQGMYSGHQHVDTSASACASLMRALYGSFRRRRGLLLLHLQHQVQVEELPWAAALQAHCGAAPHAVKHDITQQLIRLHVEFFPATPFSNVFLKEVRELTDLPLVDELAADIFQGCFSAKFLQSAQLAAPVLADTLYSRYYSIDYAALADLSVNDTEYGVSVSREFLKLCKRRAAVPRSASWVTGNAMVIEQQQILCGAHNLASFADIVKQLDPFRLASSVLQYLKGTFAKMPAADGGRNWRPRLQAVKRAAYAWRQLLFFLSFVDAEAAKTLIVRGGNWALPGELQEGLLGALEGRPPQRSFLGWSSGGHWLLDEHFWSPAPNRVINGFGASVKSF